jgi:hypothetical protein
MKKQTTLFILIWIYFLSARAQEGMWLLSQIGQLDLPAKGLQIPVNDIYNPGKPSLYNAIVQLGGGTASFVSPEGLLVTNHHVAFTALQRASSTSSDYLTNGFLAASRAAEIQAPGYQASVLLEMKDVTVEVATAAAGITDPVEAEKKINAKIIQMTELIEKDKKDIRAVISEMYNGGQYICFTYKVFKDVRIVYSPPLAIGNYGGETDNWMWPRHTGDFSFLRVYAAPDGTGREFNPENVPYRPEVWLKVSRSPVRNNDFNFILGFPGNTTRYRSSNSVHWNQEYSYPFSIRNFHEIIDLMDELTKNDPAGKIKVASLKKGLANAMKNYEGKVAGMKKTHFLQKKILFEKDFIQWANSTPETKSKYGEILSKEKLQYDLLAKNRERDDVFGIFQGLAGSMLNIAGQITYTSAELAKPESERQPGMTEENVTQNLDNLKYAYADYYEPVDKALLLRALRMVRDLPPNQRITGLDYIFSDPSKTLEQFVDAAYQSTKLGDMEYAKGLFLKKPEELSRLNDPFLRMCQAMLPMSEEIAKTNESFAANVTALRKVYLDGLYAWKGTGMYPDANGTMRFTWGPVKGYRPADAVWYEPFTSLEGVVEKNTGQEPFNAPSALVDLFQQQDFGAWMDQELNDVPVAFLNQCDITGGNSGSPVMNAKGELIGVVFDGNYEAMISDWQYDYKLQRAISVDIRYVLFVTEKLGKAGFLLDEMGVAR